jgi:hypothetical protein
MHVSGAPVAWSPVAGARDLGRHTGHKYGRSSGTPGNSRA